MVYNWYENIKIDVHDNGVLVDSTQFHNIVVNNGKNWMADCLRTTTKSLKFEYMAWGSTALPAPASTDTRLSNETGRKIITSASSGATGVCITVCYLAPTDAVGSIKELGWFSGSTATAVADSGTLISRVAYTRVKTVTESLTVTRTDTIG